MADTPAAEPTEMLTFLVAVDDEDTGNSMGLFSVRDRAVALREIPVAVLRKNLARATVALRAVFDEVAREESGVLRLKEAQIGLEVSGSGGISMVGTAQVGTTAAITLIFGER